MRRLILVLIFLIGALPSGASSIPTISSYVTDNAGILSPDSEIQLEETLRGMEKMTNGVQFAVYTEDEYPKEYSLEEYTLKIAEENGIGKKGNDNGILLYIAVKDREYRWEIGYGVESTLNSALLGRISREYLVLNFKNGDYEKGIIEAVDVVKRVLMNSSDEDIQRLITSSSKDNTRFMIMFYVIGIIVISLILLFIKGLFKFAFNFKKYRESDDFYRKAAAAIFLGGFSRRGFGRGRGGFSGGGGRFGGGGHSGGW